MTLAPAPKPDSRPPKCFVPMLVVFPCAMLFVDIALQAIDNVTPSSGGKANRHHVHPHFVHPGPSVPIWQNLFMIFFVGLNPWQICAPILASSMGFNGIPMGFQWKEMKGNESNEQPSGLLIQSRVPQTLLTLRGGLLIRCWHYLFCDQAFKHSNSIFSVFC